MQMQFDSCRLVDGVLEVAWRSDEGLHREVRVPGSDVSDLPAEVQADLADVWTPEFVADWSPDEPTIEAEPSLEEARRARLGEIEAERRAACASVIWNGQAVTIGAQTIARLDSAIATITLRSPAQRRWAIRPNVYVDLDGPGLKAMRAAINNKLEAAFVREAELADAVLAAADVEAIAAIEIAAGWPE